MKSKKQSLKQLLSGFNAEKTMPYLQKAEWAMHDVLPILLDLYGSGHVKIATFSISEESVRSFINGFDNGLLSLYLMLDYTVKKHKLPILLFADGTPADIRINSNHAKLLLFINSKVNIVVTGSANQNYNARIESGIISSNPKLFSYFDEKFDEFFAESLKFNINDLI